MCPFVLQGSIQKSWPVLSFPCCPESVLKWFIPKSLMPREYLTHEDVGDLVTPAVEIWRHYRIESQPHRLEKDDKMDIDQYI